VATIISRCPIAIKHDGVGSKVRVQVAADAGWRLMEMVNFIVL